MVIIFGYPDRTIPPRSSRRSRVSIYTETRVGFHLYLNPVNRTIVRDFPAEHTCVPRRCAKKSNAMQANVNLYFEDVF